jgi:hypothetical protein
MVAMSITLMVHPTAAIPTTIACTNSIVSSMLLVIPTMGEEM